jgi:hypothetical protein
MNNYLSDDEDNTELNNQEYDNQEDDYDEELDEEYQQELLRQKMIVYNKLKEKENNIIKVKSEENIKENNIVKVKSEENIKDNIKKQNSKLNLNTLNEYIDNIIMENKPKKFISSRVSNKKKDEPIIKEIIKKRSFSPRLEPYFKSEQYIRKKQYFNEVSFEKEDFPELK